MFAQTGGFISWDQKSHAIFRVPSYDQKGHRVKKQLLQLRVQRDAENLRWYEGDPTFPDPSKKVVVGFSDVELRRQLAEQPLAAMNSITKDLLLAVVHWFGFVVTRFIDSPKCKLYIRSIGHLHETGQWTEFYKDNLRQGSSLVWTSRD